MEKNNKSQNFLAISILIAAVLISGSIFYNKNSGSGDNNKSNNNLAVVKNNITNKSLEEVLKIKPDFDPVLGDPNAPVTIIEYSDYECPFCEIFFNQTESLIRKEFIETGKAKMIYRDFPLEFHQYAMPTALAANCAKEQGKFWTYHDEIFKNHNNLANFNYIETAKKLGMDENKFKSCFESQKYKNQIQQIFDEAKGIGVQGTPTFFVNGQMIVGAQPYDKFKTLIEQELNNIKR